MCLTYRACNFRYIAIQWEKPSTYGDAIISGYKVYVNGVVESILKPDQMTYSYTQGHWCREYGFQVQVCVWGGGGGGVRVEVERSNVVFM